ncbi:hypothetical protein CHS0354_033797 [Potamilus streckersoni]|uniref:lysozyme n=1 Tax=Potamilus streckersoni TaxID=2493646 RepID=A0AAE0SFR4_9BIVA|nr:hypothetical protein CHS0354_033797 [Potamilus streckersoni]
MAPGSTIMTQWDFGAPRPLAPKATRSIPSPIITLLYAPIIGSSDGSLILAGQVHTELNSQLTLVQFQKKPIKTESGCRPIGCHFDVNSDSCGYFQIKEPYWIDCGRLGGDWHTCANDLECSSHCVQNYIQKYVGHSGCTHTCQSYARIHNGGPAGCTHTQTVYWHLVPIIKGCH